MIVNQPEQKRKKIALVANSAWSMYNFRIDLIRHLLVQFEVLIIAPRDDFAPDLEKAGCSYLEIRFNNRSQSPWEDYSLLKSLEKIYRVEKPDFIFHYVIKPNIYGSLAAARVGISSIAIITGLGYSFDKRNWLNRIVAFLYRIALKKVGEIWFLQEEDAQIFRDRGLVDDRKVKILPGEGINTTYFSPPKQKPIARQRAFHFLMSTRLLKSKGVSIYVEAARLLGKKYRDVRFTLIGFFEKHHPDSITEGELRYWERKKIIEYSGFASDVRPFLRQADCFVFPSFYHEGIPRCLLEAASMEVPIITSENTGCREVVKEGLNGFLCAPHDPLQLCARMEEMMKLDPSERKRLGANGRLLVSKRFSMDIILREYDRVVQHL